MALEFNVGEFARRLSRALTVRGRMPLDLDERLVPVVVTERADTAPFRQRGQTWSAPFTVAAADHAGTTAAVLLGPTASIPGDRPTEYFVVDRLLIGRLASTGSTLALEWGYAAPQINPAPIFTGTMRGQETVPHGQASGWTISGDPSFSAVGSIPLGRVALPTIFVHLDLAPLNIVLHNAQDNAPNFYLSLPDTVAVSGTIEGRIFSLPLS